MISSFSASPRLLIIGGGLAGACLAWQAQQRGIDFLVVDRDNPSTSSKVAAGLVTPITGIRLNLSWRYPVFYPEAIHFYRSIERELHSIFYHEVPIVRLLRDAQATELWKKRTAQEEIRPYLKPGTGPWVDENYFSAPFGGFEMTQSGWLDTATFLEATQGLFEQQGRWQTGDVSPDAMQLTASEIRWQGQTFSHAIFCIGWEAARHPWFDWVPFKSAQGTVLSISADTGGEQRIINRGCWMLPIRPGQLRVGPTYDLNFSDPSSPSAQAIPIIEEKLLRVFKKPYQILSSQTGVRPIIHRRQALLGFHPALNRIGFFNGLGSKGVLRAPWLSRHLIEHLLLGQPIEDELDLRANL